MITGLNHVTLAVRSLATSFDFYVDIVGLRPVARSPRAAYLTAGAAWIALVEDERARSGPLPEYTHLAFSVPADRFLALASRVVGSGAKTWQDNRSEGASLYFLDPDGHKLELHVTDLAARLDWVRRHGGPSWTLYE